MKKRTKMLLLPVAAVASWILWLWLQRKRKDGQNKTPDVPG